MYAGKPIIGISGGIGSGKSFVAHLFAEAGCRVIDSDAQVRDAYHDPQIRQTVREWWGEAAFREDGEVNRAAIAHIVFADPPERARLEALIHPWVARARDAAMASAAALPEVVAFVWDTPLLFETGLYRQCDALVFVDVPLDLRLQRVQTTRGWDANELSRRENSQWPLDKKRDLSDDVFSNAADADDARRQVRPMLSRIIARTSNQPGLQ